MEKTLESEASVCFFLMMNTNLKLSFLASRVNIPVSSLVFINRAVVWWLQGGWAMRCHGEARVLASDPHMSVFWGSLFGRSLCDLLRMVRGLRNVRGQVEEMTCKWLLI